MITGVKLRIGKVFTRPQRGYYMFRGGNYECRSGRLRGMWERIITDYNVFRGGNYECRSERLRGMWERIITVHII
jgi:hypothetical protein